MINPSDRTPLWLHIGLCFTGSMIHRWFNFCITSKLYDAPSPLSTAFSRDLSRKEQQLIVKSHYFEMIFPFRDYIVIHFPVIPAEAGIQEL